MTVDEAERRLIELTLAHTRDNKTRAAEILGVTVKTLHNKLKRFRREARKSPDSDYARQSDESGKPPPSRCLIALRA